MNFNVTKVSVTDSSNGFEEERVQITITTDLPCPCFYNGSKPYTFEWDVSNRAEAEEWLAKYYSNAPRG